MLARPPPPHSISYRPTLAEMLKGAWIQYAAMLLLVLPVVRWVRGVVFVDQLLETGVSVDGAGIAHRGRKLHAF